MRKLSRTRLWSVLLPIMVAGLLAACGTSEPSRPQTYTVGLLNSLQTPLMTDSFKQGLAAQGYTEGQNITYVVEDTAGDLSKLGAAAQNLRQAQPDLIFVTATRGAQVLHQVISDTTIPIVFAAVTDPVSAGLVESFDHPGGTVTGVTTSARGGAEHGRRLELLRDMAPTIKRVYLPYNPENRAIQGPLEAVRKAAAGLGVELVTAEVSTPEEIQAAMTTIPEDVDAIFLLPERSFGTSIAELIKGALARKLPVSVSDGESAKQPGVLMGYGSEFPAMSEQAARLGDKILKGGQPAEIPVETPEFFLTVNMQTAKAIDLTIPDATLQQAQTVIRE